MNPYLPPVITRQRQGGINPSARGGMQYLDGIDGVSVASLVERHGSPLFVFSERTLRDTVRRMREVFTSRYRETRFGWSYKTNYLKAVCGVFHQEGSLAEVVSGFEYEKARAMGVSGRDIIFNGPHKTRADLERAVREGARIQVDHFEELAELEAVARETGVSIPVGIRVFLDAGIRPVWSKFGFCADDGEAGEAIRRIARSGGRLTLAGLHCHVGTCILEPRAYRETVEALCDLAAWARETWGQEIDWINLGGGLPSSNTLHGQYRPAKESNPPIEEYADAICGPLAARYAGAAKRPLLLLESGRAMVDDAGHLITSVVAVKRGHKESAAGLSPALDPKGLVPQTSGGGVTPGVICDAGVHLLYTAPWFRLEVLPTRKPAGPPSDVRLFGCLCMNIDVIRESVALPPLASGDHLVIRPVGAYTVTQSMQFISYRPRVVMIDPDGRDHVIRERENLEYVEAMDRVPAHLRTWEQS